MRAGRSTHEKLALWGSLGGQCIFDPWYFLYPLADLLCCWPVGHTGAANQMGLALTSSTLPIQLRQCDLWPFRTWSLVCVRCCTPMSTRDTFPESFIDTQTLKKRALYHYLSWFWLLLHNRAVINGRPVHRWRQSQYTTCIRESCACTGWESTHYRTLWQPYEVGVAVFAVRGNEAMLRCGPSPFLSHVPHAYRPAAGRLIVRVTPTPAGRSDTMKVRVIL